MIEKAFRNLIKKCDGITYTQNKRGGFDFLSLSKILEENSKIIQSIFRKLDNNIVYYFKFALTDKSGWNLRNNLAHSIGDKQFIQPAPSHCLFHIMICLLLVDKIKKPLYHITNKLVSTY